MHEPKSFEYQSMGTHWKISLWDNIDDALLKQLEESIITQSQEFDRTYSRFNKESLIWSLTEKRGIVEVPKDLIDMLRLYERLHDLSGGKCNPLIGFAISDLGYDEEYTLKPKDVIRPVPPFHNAVTILDDHRIDLRESVLIDVGALGKGFFVDKMTALLRGKGMKHFLVDGSGDMYYQSNGEPLRVGLEHPGDATKVIGALDMLDGAMCGSAGNRRKWKQFHHTIDPFSLTSPQEIIATWVMSPSAALSDGLATCFFLVEPERFEKDFVFDYCLLNRDYQIKRSAGFAAELF